MINFLLFLILDLGCGQGCVTQKIAEAHPTAHVTGIDLQASLIETAQKNYPHLRFIQGDAENLNIHEEYDLIISISLLHLVSNPQKVLQETFNALKPGGKIDMQIPAEMCPALAQAIEMLLATDRWNPYFVDFQIGWAIKGLTEYQGMMEVEGFTTVRTNSFEDAQYFNSKHELKNFLSCWLPYLRQIPDSLKDVFQNELIELYLNYQPLDSQGRIPFIVHRYQLNGQKQLF